MKLEGFHLPHQPAVPVRVMEYAGGRLSLTVPRLTPVMLDDELTALAAARERFLVGREVAGIVALVDRVARRLLDSGDGLRRDALEGIGATTGFSAPMASLILDRMAGEWRRDRLTDLLRAEFGDPAVLDRFVEVGGRFCRALGPARAVHVFSGNVPGVAVTSLIRSLLVKSAVLGKTASGEPVLPALFARALAEADAEVGQCVAIVYWPSEDERLLATALARADLVVAYGGSAAIDGIRRGMGPGVPLLEYGPHLSVAVVAREALADDARRVAGEAALAVATFDQHGCVSPHVVFVENGGQVAPEIWAQMIAEELAELESILPRGFVDDAEAAALAQLRGESEFAELAGKGRLFVSAGEIKWMVIYDPISNFEPSCLNRVVRVVPVAEVENVVERLGRVGGVLQTVGYAGPSERFMGVAEGVARLGASRIAPLGEMAWPPGTWHHDGRHPLLDMVRWCDWEPGVDGTPLAPPLLDRKLPNV